MLKLPHWVLPDKFPAVYDSESATVIEQTAKVYGAMNALIEEYNKFVDNVNAEINYFETTTNANIDDFKSCMTEIMSNFTECMQTKIDDAIFYMKENIEGTTTVIVNDALSNGTIKVVERYDPNSESLEMVAEGSV